MREIAKLKELRQNDLKPWNEELKQNRADKMREGIPQMVNLKARIALYESVLNSYPEQNASLEEMAKFVYGFDSNYSFEMQTGVPTPAAAFQPSTKEKELLATFESQGKKLQKLLKSYQESAPKVIELLNSMRQTCTDLAKLRSENLAFWNQQFVQNRADKMRRTADHAGIERTQFNIRRGVGMFSADAIGRNKVFVTMSAEEIVK